MKKRFTSTKSSVLHQLSLLVLLGVASPFVYGSTPIYEEIPGDVSDALHEYGEWENNIKTALEEEELPRYWAERGLYNKVLEQPEPSAATLYRIAKTCHVDGNKNWCAQNTIIEKLIAIDPDNAAVYFADFPDPGMYLELDYLKKLDVEESRNRLHQASLATYVDEYQGRDAVSWAKAARKLSVQMPPPQQAVAVLVEGYKKGISEQNLHAFHRPIEAVIWKYVEGNSWGSPLGGLPRFCKLMAQLSEEESMIHCELVADLLMRDETGLYDYLGRSIKNELLSVVDPDSPELENLGIVRRSDSDLDTDACNRPIWHRSYVIPNGGVKDLNLYYQDLQDSSYSVAMMNAVKREIVAAGLPAADCRNRENSIIIIRSYWPDYLPQQVSENQLEMPNVDGSAYIAYAIGAAVYATKL
jgi:hypothetical protein